MPKYSPEQQASIAAALKTPEGKRKLSQVLHEEIQKRLHEARRRPINQTPDLSRED